MSYEVIESNVASTKEDIIKILETNMGSDADFKRRIPWFYHDNIAGEGTIFLLISKSDEVKNNVVGCTGFSPRRFRYSGISSTAYLFADFAVDKTHRLLSPAILLQRTALTKAQQQSEFCYGFPNSAAVGVLCRIGFKKVGGIRRYVKVLRYETYLQQRLPYNWIAKLGGVLLDTSDRLIDGIKNARVPRKFYLEWIKDFDERFDELWENVRDKYPILGDRSSKMLQWRYGKKSFKPAEIATLVDKRSKQLYAYAIILRDGSGSAISDFFGLNNEMIGFLFSRLFPGLRKQGFISITVHFFGDNEVVQIINAQGFVYRSTPNIMVVAESTNKRFEVEGRKITSPDIWFYITKADTDF